MAFTGWRQRKPIGDKKRARSKAEENQARSFEELMGLHRLDFWHCRVSQQSQPGFPDYVILGDGWLAFVELKARSTTDNRMGRVSDAQRRYEESIKAAGAEWRVIKLPDEWPETYQWLTGKTGIVCKEVWP